MTKRLLVILIVVMLAGLGWAARELYRPYRGFSGNVMVVIEPGTHSVRAAGLLVERGVLASRWPFLLRYWVARPRASLKAGEYFFDRPLRPLDVYRKLVIGDVYLHAVVIPEGSDRFDMARIFHEQFNISPQDFLRASEQAAAIHDLAPQATTLEGYLFPDTYRLPRGVTAAGVVAAMLARFRHVMESRFAAEIRENPNELHQLITLASLVEKETPVPGERPVIAGVFVKRLEKGIPLQCDPTVIYAARLNDRPVIPIKQSDLDFDSPYNTYRHAGLPPGPISSPGEAAIRAAFHPGAGDFLYFVSNNHGGHIFSKTLAEHQRNVARYRQEVTALRRISSGKAKLGVDSGRRKAADATSRMSRDSKQKQKAAHSGARRDARSRTAGGAATASPAGGTPPAPRP
ncbi:MAG: endolytic transglycosylase MltG [Terriglobia bacterium]